MIAIRITAEEPGALTCTVSLATPHDGSVAAAGGREIVLTGQVPDRVTPRHEHARVTVDRNRRQATVFAAVVRVRADGGSVQETPDGRLRVVGADALTLLVAAGDSFAGWDSPDLVGLLFDLGRYLLIAPSRPGTQPTTLQGIWNTDVRPDWRATGRRTSTCR